MFHVTCVPGAKEKTSQGKMAGKKKPPRTGRPKGSTTIPLEVQDGILGQMLPHGAEGETTFVALTNFSFRAKGRVTEKLLGTVFDATFPEMSENKRYHRFFCPSIR